MLEQEILDRETVQRIYKIPSWIHKMDLNGVTTPGLYDPRGKYDIFGLPERLDGLTVLDIGCADGYYSFESERRGASVVSVDRSLHGFDLAKEILGSKAEHHIKDFMEFVDERRFDIVLFLGILYHLRHPFLALEKLRRLCKNSGVAFIESEIEERKSFHSDESYMHFMCGSELQNDGSNWWVPNLACLQEMVKACGFEPEVVWKEGNRACVKAFAR